MMLVLLASVPFAFGFVGTKRPAAGHNIRLRDGGVPEWDSIMPEGERTAKRGKEVRDRIAKLREYKKQGRRYDGSREDPEKKDLDSDAGFGQLMNEAEALFAEKEKETTSGIGGTWIPKNVTDFHQPTVTTWGQFPRPRDISAAYGGGKRIGVGVAVNETERQLSAEKTKAMLAKYREKTGKDQRVIDANKENIEKAIAYAKARVLRGAAFEAVEALKSVEEFLTPRTPLGATALLELALCCEASGDTDEAKRIYAQLARSPVGDIKRKALQLSYGFEAQEKLKVESFKGSEASKQALKAWTFDFSGEGRTSFYATGVTTMPLSSGTSRKKGGRMSSGTEFDEVKIRDTSEAFEILRRASLGGATFAKASLVAKALEVYEVDAAKKNKKGKQGEVVYYQDDDDDDDEEESSAVSEMKVPPLDDDEDDEPPAKRVAKRVASSTFSRLEGDWTVLFSAAGKGQYYESGGITVSFNKRGQVRRRLPLFGGLLFVDWTGHATDDEGNSFAAVRDTVSPAFLSTFVDERWHVELLHVDDRLCALKTNFNDLILCKKRPKQRW